MNIEPLSFLPVGSAIAQLPRRSCRTCRLHRYVAKLDILHCEHAPAIPFGRGVIYVDVLAADAAPINKAALEARCEAIAADCRNYQEES